MKRRHVIGGLAGLAVVFGVGTACTPSVTPTTAPQPAPPADSQFITPPANFVGLWTFCDHGNRVYETADPAGSENTSQVTVAPQDPSCAGPTVRR